MGTIKLDKDEMLKIAGELSVLKEEINYILNKTHETYNVLRRENSVSTYSQERKLSDIQDLAYNLVREFDKISDNFYQAAKAYESTEDKLTNLVNINKDNNIKNIIAVNSMNNTYFDSDNTKSEKKEETTFDKLKELVQEGWQLVKDYYGLKIAVMDFVKDICDNINTCIDGYIESHEEFFEEFNEEHPILSVICFPLQQLVAVRDVTLNFLKEMTFELVSNIFGMLSYEYHGLVENPDETVKENIQSILIIKAILSPTSKGEVEIRDRVLLGIWEDIKADFNSEVINGNPYTASRYVYNLAIEIGSLFFGAGELKAAAGVKKADNVIDGMRAIDKVSDVKKLSNGELWFNYFNKVYGAENVEWTSKVFEGNAGLRERVFGNIEKSRLARESSNYSGFAKFEKKFVVEGVTQAERLIPGTPGVVTGGNSTKLGKNIMESMGLKRSTKWTGYQAQHIIPAEMADNPILKKIGMNLDDATNGILLRTPDAELSAMSRHRGYHSVYNDVVRNQLNNMDINQSVDVLQRQVLDLQSDLRKLQESGLPLYPSQGATVDLWERSLNRIRK